MCWSEYSHAGYFPTCIQGCKYTNETRCSIEDASINSGQRWIAALNGTASGGGYELALACEEIYLIDDGNAAVSLPEVPLLGVLPGTGGLTRLTDKRKIRRDISDIFCTKAEGFRANKAKKYKLIDGSFTKSKWAIGMQKVTTRIVDEIADKPGNVSGVTLSPITAESTDTGWKYQHVQVEMNVPLKRSATITVHSTNEAPSRSVDTWALKAFRELEDALLRLRFNHLDVGLIILKTIGSTDDVLTHDKWVLENSEKDWFINEIRLFQTRTLRKLDNMAKSMYALIESGSCFGGSLFELTLSADRSYMFLDDDGENTITLSAANLGIHSMSNGMSRLEARFLGDADALSEAVSAAQGDGQSESSTFDADEAMELELVTESLDDIDYEEEMRIVTEERLAFSPDALTGMEQNLRFVGKESAETRIYGRLSAWQNWIFQRPNAVGERRRSHHVRTPRTTHL